MPRKLTHEYIAGQFALEGYKLLSEYTNTSSRLNFICTNGHKHFTSWASFQQGKRCAICAGKFVDIEHVKKEFELLGFKLLDTNYQNKQQKLNFICPNGHKHFTSWGAFSANKACAICSGKFVYPEQVRLAFESEGYQLLENYQRSNQQLKFICPNGHQHSMKWNSFQSGIRCGLCAKNQKRSVNSVKKELERYGYILVGNYLSNNHPMDVICPHGHKTFIRRASFINGSRCGVCHAQDFYKNYKNKGFNRLVGSIKRDITRQNFEFNWNYFYDATFIKDLAKPIQPMYESCPQGHAVDHIVPVSWFNLLKEDELLACWNINNLRHLDAVENNKRGNKMTQEEIAFMLANHPEILEASSRWKSMNS